VSDKIITVYLTKKCVSFILSNEPCIENYWLSLFRKVQFLKFDTGSLGKIWF